MNRLYNLLIPTIFFSLPREEFDLSRDTLGDEQGGGYRASSPRPKYAHDDSGLDHGHKHEGHDFAHDFQDVGEHHADEAHHHGKPKVAGSTP
jgi:hypothetical protein